MFVVDDNFIGNKRDAMRLLPAVKQWQEERQFPFSLFTEASVNLVEIPEMLDAMSNAGFNMVFLGIESPNDDALLGTSKGQNTSKEEKAGSYLLRAVRKIQNKGIEVTGGFIIGLDGDTEFDSHINFIQEAGIPAAIAGLLNALKETDLWHRLKQENRLLVESTGNSTDMSLNFVPEMPREKLLSEYRRVISTLYDPTLKNYFTPVFNPASVYASYATQCEIDSKRGPARVYPVNSAATFLQTGFRVRTIFSEGTQKLSQNVP